MDFILSLAHFCENHGPKSIICTQIQPVSCASCYPGSISSSVADLVSSFKPGSSWSGQDHTETSGRSSFDSPEFNDTAPTSVGTSPDLSSTDGANPGAHVSESLNSLDRVPLKRYSGPSNETVCESCIISLPEDTSKHLPYGAPGSPRKDGSGKNGSPILRSRELLQVYGSQQSDSDSEDEADIQHKTAESFDTDDTSGSYYHDHTLTYISASSPSDPNTFSTVRNATVRAMSCEQLPRGVTAGQLSFGDPVNGYAIAYKFRLPDPQARGGHKKYALLALASNERYARQATTYVWARFQHIASSLMARVEHTIAQSRRGGNLHDAVGQSGLMPIDSFLTGRMTDPDGYPRIGGMRPKARGLTEMVGDENLFPELHLHFIGLLRDLRDRFGI